MTALFVCCTVVIADDDDGDDDDDDGDDEDDVVAVVRATEAAAVVENIKALGPVGCLLEALSEAVCLSCGDSSNPSKAASIAK